jgi:2-keto-4-pentenoate hydratase/2-oxohepta-3-ene-1,7-dioic acid hydratase in catechol pathway
MRLVRVAGSGTGIVVDHTGVDYVVDIVTAATALSPERSAVADGLSALLTDPAQSWRPLVDDWESARGSLLELTEVALDDLARGRDRLGVRALAEVDLDPPLPSPTSRIFAAGGNFPMHVSKMVTNTVKSSSIGAQTETVPWGFYVIPGTIVGDKATIAPPESAQKLDYEAEVAVVLGGGEHQPCNDEISVWGYTAWNDFSIRDGALGLTRVDHGPLTWSLTKNFRTGHSCGPWMVVGSDVDTGDLSISCRVNGETRQDGTTADMQFSFGRMAAHIAEYAPIGGGDLVLSGTPGGTAMEQGIDGPYLKDGDRVEVLVQGVGVLRNQIKMG